MNQPTLAHNLRGHLGICREVLCLVEREGQSLNDPAMPSQFEYYQARKTLLPKLAESLGRIREQRLEWQRLSPAERERNGDVQSLLRENRDLIMKIIVLDRQNEQTLLRRGMVPARHIPPAKSQRPHFVAEMYRRNGIG